MGELFYAAALMVIVGSYAVIALMLLWNEAGPWLSAWLAKRMPPADATQNASPPNSAARTDTTVERPTFHPNL